MRALVWFRGDLRTIDNPALAAACAAASRGVLAAFTICPEQWREHDWGPKRVNLLRRTLAELSNALAQRNIALRLLERPRFEGVERDLLALAREHGCDALFFNEEYEVNERTRDAAVRRAFNDAGLRVRTFHDQVVFPPGEVLTNDGKPYTVYSPFKRRWHALYKAGDAPRAQGAPASQQAMVSRPDPIPTALGDYDPRDDREDLWPAGERAALGRLGAFIAHRIDAYKDQRDLPAVDATSRLSPYLANGTLSPRQCIDAALDANQGRLDKGGKGPVHWMSEVIWRDFYRHILVAFPRVCKGYAFNPRYDIPWRDDQDALNAWRKGRTGYPIIDAAMRQLETTGWMHNRLRMAVAMFLTKDLLIDWRLGERHFMRHLVDADLASNNGGWQWSAATGTDAAPYFRIFNPTTQSQKFDPDGAFIREHLPELAHLPGEAIHQPHAHAGLFEELDYPQPIVDHAAARERALAAFKVDQPA